MAAHAYPRAVLQERERPTSHVKLFAPDRHPLTTQLYPKPGQTEIAFDFVLTPQ